jgi:hypothetical protein
MFFKQFIHRVPMSAKRLLRTTMAFAVRVRNHPNAI